MFVCSNELDPHPNVIARNPPVGGDEAISPLADASTTPFTLSPCTQKSLHA